jgi:hypothetical protein
MFIYLSTEAAKYTAVISLILELKKEANFTKQVILSVPTNVYMGHVEWAVI